MFSRHLEKGTPYILINYDDQSSRTDTITSGSAADSKSLIIYKNGNPNLKDRRLAQIVNAVRELEEITGLESLDIEFAVTQSGELYILQVRPITLHKSVPPAQDIGRHIGQIKDQVRARMQPYPFVYGQTTVLADMPDWNPAEMIGTRPNPLALSLYQYLITDAAWRDARAQIGYHNPVPEKLLFCLGGHPYIDARNSFNNLTPARLTTELNHKLIDHYIRRLKQHPYFHDKVEFEIVLTCYSPDFEVHAQRLYDDGFSESEVKELRGALQKMTNNILSGSVCPIDELLAQTESLNPRRQELLSRDYGKDEIPTLIGLLLDDCITNGTEPFSILARYGFIAASMMRGLVYRGVISEEDKNAFMNSIDTVAGDMVSDMDKVLSGEKSVEDFLSVYGHLRPGSYDILSYSYDEKPEYYFPGGGEEGNHREHRVGTEDTGEVTERLRDGETERRSDGVTESEEHSGSNVSTFSDEKLRAIDQLLNEDGFDINAEQLLEFVLKATAGREYAKFQFTKNLNAVLKLAAEYGSAHGFSREDMCYMFIEDILRMQKTSIPKNNTIYLKQKIQEGKDWYETANLVETPQIITSPEDLDVIEYNEAKPNFVTSNIITGTVSFLKGDPGQVDLEDKIVLIEGADPGYDWIFMHPIKGLITKYGGAASHMTIRCAEFNLPAAIGCGEELFSKLENAETVELNCVNEQIRVLG